MIEAQDAFPACAGMILSFVMGRKYGERVPRVRGDDPQALVTATAILERSPRARG